MTRGARGPRRVAALAAVAVLAGGCSSSEPASVRVVHEVRPQPTATDVATTTPLATPSPRPTVMAAPRPRPTVRVLPLALRVKGRPGRVALTFDDGPHPVFTRRILDTLDRFGAKATFFVLGRQAKRYPGIVREIARRGHVVAGHTWNHTTLTGLSSERFAHEVDDANALIEELTGDRVRCVRPPRGRYDRTVRARLRARGLELAMWTVDPRDWTSPGTTTIAARTARGMRSRAIVLLHDGGQDRTQTVAALPAILRAGRAAGMSFDPICGGGPEPTPAPAPAPTPTQRPSRTERPERTATPAPEPSATPALPDLLGSV